MRVTKSLLGYGIIAWLVYVAAWLAQTLTRKAFSLTWDAASLLANGHLGWIQSATFLLTDAMVIVGANGRPCGTVCAVGRPRLIGLYVLDVAASGVSAPTRWTVSRPGLRPDQPAT